MDEGRKRGLVDVFADIDGRLRYGLVRVRSAGREGLRLCAVRCEQRRVASASAHAFGTYVTIGGLTPLSMPTASTNLVTITRVAVDTFLVTRQNLEAVKWRGVVSF